MLKRTRFAAALAVLWTGVGLHASAAPTPCGPGGTTESAGGGWVASYPAFSTGPKAISLLAAPAFDPNLVYASNGSELMQSLDAGCGWTRVYSATSGAGSVPGSTVAITALNVPSSATSSSLVYVGLTRTTVPGVSTPAVAVSADRGARFTLQESGQGLPLLGSVNELVANAQVPQVAYAVLDTGVVSTSRQIYATTDGGTTWTKRTPSGESFDGRQLATHPTTQTDLFALSGGQMVRSEDGGATFTAATPSGPVGSLGAAAGAGGLRLAAGRTDAPYVETSSDRGTNWLRIDSPMTPRSVAPAPLQGIVAVADARDTYLLLPTPIRISPTGGSPTSLSITAPTARGFSVTGLRAGAMLRATVDLDGRVIAPVVTPGGAVRPVTLRPPGVFKQFPSLLLPAGLQVSLPAGATRTVPYRLLVPRTPAPVDVMFIVDSTSSMQKVIDDLLNGLSDITNALSASGLDVKFGVGDFRDYPSPVGPAAAADWAWRRDRVIGSSGKELEDAIRQIVAAGGTCDGGQSMHGALFVSTTGTDLVGGRQVPVEDARAGYRDGSLRLAMVATDAPPHEAGQTYAQYRPEQPRELQCATSVTQPGPGLDQVLAAVRAHGVHTIGLAVPGGTSGDPTPGLLEVADGSRTYAPPGGVDCDGNGSVDLPSGAPLVCPTRPADNSATVNVNGTVVQQGQQAANGLTAAVVGLAAGIPDLKPVGVTVGKGAAFATLRGTARKELNLRADNELPFDLVVHCPLRPASRQRIDLVAATPSQTLATGTLELSCGGVPSGLPLALVPPLRALAEVAPPPPAPGQPVPNPNPNPNTNPNPNPAANVNVNPGVADQQEQESQLAFAESSESESLAMNTWMFVAVAGLMTCTAGGLALRRRTSEALQRA